MPAESARRARATDRRDAPPKEAIAVDDAPRARAPRGAVRRSSAQPVRRRARHARGPVSVRRVRRAPAAHRLGPAAGSVRGARGAPRGSRSMNGGTIPDRGLYGVLSRATAAAARRRARRGDGLRERVRARLPARRLEWRIEEITRDRVLVDARAGRAGQDAVLARRRAAARRAGRAIGRARRASSRRARRQPRRSSGSARTTTSTSARRATWSPTCVNRGCDRRGARPTDRSWSSASATRSATGGSASSRRSAPRARAVGSGARAGCASARASRPKSHVVGRRHRVAPARRRRAAAGRRICSSHPTRSRSWSPQALGGSRSSRALPRERRARAAPPAAAPRPAHAALGAAQTRAGPAPGRRRYRSFPIVLETYRECLRDVFDLPALRGLLRWHRGSSGARGRRRDESASPFASSLLFDYVGDYMYEDDTPARRASRPGALARPRPAPGAARPGGAAGADRRAGARGRRAPLARRAANSRSIARCSSYAW